MRWRRVQALERRLRSIQVADSRPGRPDLGVQGLRRLARHRRRVLHAARDSGRAGATATGDRLDGRDGPQPVTKRRTATIDVLAGIGPTLTTSPGRRAWIHVSLSMAMPT